MMTNGTTSGWMTVATFIVGFAAGLGTGHIVDDAKASVGRVIQLGKRLVV